MKLKILLVFKDRVGIVADISALIAQHGLNIVAMEVVREADKANVYVEAENGVKSSHRQEIFAILGRIPDLIESRFIDTLPQEERENRFRVVLDNISDGVVSIDKDGRVTTINKIALKALNQHRQEVVGINVKTLNLPDHTILECLQGKTFNNAKKDLITGTGRFQYLATSRPIKDSAGHIIGAVEIAKDVQEIKKLAQSITTPGSIVFSDIIGRHPSILSAITFAKKIAETDSIISIRGASGTGKELFARAIHSASGRKGSFVPINCAALPEQLFESELFGYDRGAFTGGRKEGKPGLFEIAKDGTIFLDEIAEMPLNFQAKILRVIQDKCVRRVGGSAEIQIDARIVTATNRNLEQRVAHKAFRQDLYYRINVLPIHIPPLRERSDDILLLVNHFLFQLAAKLVRQIQGISPDGMAKLLRHDWPGNVRELKNVVERAAILWDGKQIDVDCIMFSHEIGETINPDSGQPIPEKPEGRALREAMADYETRLIRDSLAVSKSIREAARDLKISHTALLNKLKKYHIKMEMKRTIVNKLDQ
ncbi:MAG: sigma 54-interacting transcriptional regulator [Desulfobacteraceae bacterium]|nr:sigma 54-interacting transcriptional regulator [Desulfobacteraceae bacterium]